MTDRYPIPDFLRRQPEQAAEPRERPILFSPEMVRAILAGTKTQTRRVVKHHPSDDGNMVLVDHGNGWWPYRSDDSESPVVNGSDEIPYCCPYGKPGDRLWVRESLKAKDGYMVYAADEGRIDCGDMDWPSCIEKRKSIPSIHMPRWASRITLEITAVRVERLQSISHDDAMAEGMAWDDAIYDYSRLWERINGAGSWDVNPWVWCVSFLRITQ